MLAALQRLRRSLLRTAAAIKSFVAGVLHPHRRSPPRSPAAPLPLPAAIHPFDIVYGVDTSGLITSRQLLSDQRNSSWSTAYYAIAPSIFGAVIDRIAPVIGQRWQNFSFVDLGAGKGRALMLAARLPFAAVLGVELNPDLFQICRRNLRRFRASDDLLPTVRCASLEVREGDATGLLYPLTPLVVYLYHPFLAPVLRRCLFHLRRSLRAHPREVWMLYINAESEAVFDQFPELHREWEQTFVMDTTDILADRTGSTEERVVAFHYTP